MPTDLMALANHHLDMARLAIDRIQEAPDVPAALEKVGRLLEKTEAVDDALYRLGDRLDPCGAPSPREDPLVPSHIRCAIRRHGTERNHQATVGETTYSWPWPPEGD